MVQINYGVYMSSHKDTFVFSVTTVFMCTRHSQGSENMLYTKHVCEGSKEACKLISIQVIHKKAAQRQALATVLASMWI